MFERKGIIIEFVGPPGSGKTTSSLVFAEQLRKKGLIVLLREDLKLYVKNKGLISKLRLFVNTLFFKGPILIHFTIKLALHKIFSFDAIYRYLKLSFYNLALSEFRRQTKADIIILDQWIIQEIWSATIFKRTDYYKLLKKMERFYFRTDTVIYLEADAVTASTRIEFRQNGLSRFDRMSPIVREQQIEKYNMYLFQLYNISPCQVKHVLPANQLPSHNASAFISHLTVFFKRELLEMRSEVRQKSRIHKTIEL